ncbi:unnamed protein product [Phytophthora lilii]|uniref:Unnamed protein product n=1 Tax=Phytophthora lilii TaxID=2077276 RepID=A0A9W6TBY1_9STRA|nr:unnamed protein product [Phytophthora lilii]
MLKKRKFKAKMFKKWDNYRIDELTKKIGEENLSNKAITKLFMDYIENTGPRTYICDRFSRQASGKINNQ